MIFDAGFFVMLFFIWGIPLLWAGWKFLIMSAEEQKSAVKDKLSWEYFSTIGLLTIGVLLLMIGNFWVLHKIAIAGISVLCLGACFMVFNAWGKNKIASLVLLLLLSGLVLLYLSEFSA